jgi:hypothetical protein
MRLRYYASVSRLAFDAAVLMPELTGVLYWQRAAAYGQNKCNNLAFPIVNFGFSIELILNSYDT